MPPQLPADRVAQLRARGATLRLEGAAAAASAALEGAGVRLLLLKGASLAAWLYRDDEPRSYVDCDLLIAPDAVDVAGTVLATLGYTLAFDERSMPPWWREHASTWVRGDGVTIDLHRTLPGVGVDDRSVWRTLSRTSQVIVVAGRAIPTLGLPARALNLALHAAQHGSGWGHVIRDLQRGLALADEGTWRQAAVLADELGATESFAAGLRLTEAGAELARRLELPATRSVDVVLRASTPPPLALGFEQLARARGVRARLEFVRLKLIPPPAFIRHWDQRAGESRYSLTRAYLRRPLWLLQHAPRGYRAWRAARASARAPEKTTDR